MTMGMGIGPELVRHDATGKLAGSLQQAGNGEPLLMMEGLIF
jgi:hypothetical protein